MTNQLTRTLANNANPNLIASSTLTEEQSYQNFRTASELVGAMTIAHAKNFTNGNIAQACEDIEDNTQWTAKTLELKVNAYNTRKALLAKHQEETEAKQALLDIKAKKLRDNKMLETARKEEELRAIREEIKENKIRENKFCSKVEKMSDDTVMRLPDITPPKAPTSNKKQLRDRYTEQVDKKEKAYQEIKEVIDLLDTHELTATHIAIVKKARATYPYMKQWKIGMAIVAVSNYAHHPEIQELNNPTVEEVILAKEAYTARMTAETSRTIEQRAEDTERIAERDKQRKQEALDSMPSHAQLIRNNRRTTHTLKPFELTRGDVITAVTAKDIVKSLLAIGLTDEDMQVVAKEMCKKQTVTDIIGQLKKIELTNADTKRLIKAVTP